MRLMELVAGCGQSTTEAKSKPDKRLGNLWRVSVTAVVAAANNGQELVSCIKTNSSKSPKKEIEGAMKNCTSGSYYVAICNVPNEGDNIKIDYITYKYNAKKVLHFVKTAGARSTVPDPN